MVRLTEFSLLAAALTIGLLASTDPAYAQLFDSALDRLSPVERAELRTGNVTITGDRGRYTARILLDSTPEAAWVVLTDYANFSRFIPSVISSRIVNQTETEKVIEQVDERSLLLVKVRSRVRLAITETPQQRINFRRIQGDVPKLDGYWLIEPIAPYAGAASNQVMVSQFVEVKPSSNFGADVFYNIFKQALRENLLAIRREADRRKLLTPRQNAPEASLTPYRVANQSMRADNRKPLLNWP
jgi:ribosome-associated toxin RatA of RatAB toxin-antitoxin module